MVVEKGIFKPRCYRVNELSPYASFVLLVSMAEEIPAHSVIRRFLEFFVARFRNLLINTPKSDLE